MYGEIYLLSLLHKLLSRTLRIDSKDHLPEHVSRNLRSKSKTCVVITHFIKMNSTPLTIGTREYLVINASTKFFKFLINSREFRLMSTREALQFSEKT